MSKTETEDELCARLLANDHALSVSAARLLAAINAPAPAEPEDGERWDADFEGFRN